MYTQWTPQYAVYTNLQVVLEDRELNQGPAELTEK